MRKSPIHGQHVALGAKFAEFGGWEMPLQYTSILEEHRAVRERVGLFDVSHLGKVSVKGKGALSFLNSVLANDLNKVGLGKAQYTMVCDDSGGVVDDLIAYVHSEEDVFLIPNAANTASVVEVLIKRAPAEVVVENQHEEHAVLALQGPRSSDVLRRLGIEPIGEYMSFARLSEPMRLTLCRTGYTGELGYELVCASADAPQLWDALLKAGEEFGIRAAGLGARDTLRTEMGYALHGHEISLEIDPVSAGLSWAIGWAKETFTGAERLRAIKESGPTRRSRGLLALGRGIPRPGMRVLGPDGAEIGTVTSGTFSPTLKQGIALALVDSAFKPGDEVSIQVRNRQEPFQIVKMPFIQPGVK